MKLRIIYLYNNNKPVKDISVNLWQIVSLKKEQNHFCATLFQERCIKEGDLKKGIKKIQHCLGGS